MLDGIKILVADDDKLNQKIVNFILKKLGAEVVTVGNGREAIDAAERHQFDIILMDLQMPGMDGYMAATHIRNNISRDVPIIALTADIVADEEDEYKKSGMNACISKPVSQNELCELILNFVPSKNQRELIFQ